MKFKTFALIFLLAILLLLAAYKIFVEGGFSFGSSSSSSNSQPDSQYNLH
jgi:hypothetical protein